MSGSNHTTTSRRTFLAAAGGVLGTTGLAGCLGGSDDTQFVTIGTGGQGGVYYPLGGGIADILSAELDGVSATAETTGASVENCRYVGDEEMTLGFSLGNSAINAVSGTRDFEETQPIQAAFGAYQNHTQVVVSEDSDVETLADLKGLNVSVGAPGSGTEVIAEELLDWYGVSYDDIDEERLGFSETASSIQDGQLDAGFWSVAAPASSIEQLSSQRDIRILDFSEDIAAITDEFQHYNNGTIPASTYPGQDSAVNIPSVTNTVVVHENEDDDFVYDMVEATFENLNRLREIHEVANEFETTARNAPIELHPGAEQYFDDAGL